MKLRRPLTFELRDSEDGQTFFVIVSGNGQVIATSETYRRKSSATKAAKSIIGRASSAVVHDRTGERAET